MSISYNTYLSQPFSTHLGCFVSWFLSGSHRVLLGYHFHEPSGAFFELSHGGEENFAKLEEMWEFRCVEAGCPQAGDRFANKDQLTKHLKEKHGLFLCDLCWQHKAQFPSEQARFTSQQLKLHLKQGNSATGEKGHPWCKFCKRGFYNDEMLFEHLNKEHEYCHICRKEGKSDDYYRDRKALFRHFKRCHVVCPEPQCLEEFKVFPDEIGLHNHNRVFHPEKEQSRSVPISFNVKRRGYDGSGIEQGRNDSGNDSQEEGEIRLDSFAFAYRPGQDETSTPRELSGPSAPIINAAGPANNFGRWASAAGAFNVGSRLQDNNQFPTLASGAQGTGASQSTWGPKSAEQGTHNSFASAIGGGHGNLRFYSRSQREKERRKRGGGRNGAISNATSRQASEQEQIQASTMTSSARAPQPVENTSTVPLSEKIRIALNRDADKFREFQQLCGGLNQRKITVEHFYPRVAQLLKTHLNELLPQLIDKLPDKALAKELEGFHTATQISHDLSQMKTEDQPSQQQLPRRTRWAEATSGGGGASRTTNRAQLQKEDFPALVSDAPAKQQPSKSGEIGAKGGRKSAVVRLYTPQSKAVAKKKTKKKKKKNPTSVIDMF